MNEYYKIETDVEKLTRKLKETKANLNSFTEIQDKRLAKIQQNFDNLKRETEEFFQTISFDTNASHSNVEKLNEDFKQFGNDLEYTKKFGNDIDQMKKRTKVLEKKIEEIFLIMQINQNENRKQEIELNDLKSEFMELKKNIQIKTTDKQHEDGFDNEVKYSTTSENNNNTISEDHNPFTLLPETKIDQLYAEHHAKGNPVLEPVSSSFTNIDKTNNCVTNFADDPETVEEYTKTQIFKEQKFQTQGNYFMKLKKYQEAVDCYHNGIKEEQTAELCGNLSCAYYYLNSFDVALEWAQKSIEINPSYEKAYGRAGMSCLQLSSYTLALSYFKKGLELKPSSETHLKGFALAKKELEKSVDSNVKTISPNEILGNMFDSNTMKKMMQTDGFNDLLKNTITNHPDLIMGVANSMMGLKNATQNTPSETNTTSQNSTESENP